MVWLKNGDDLACHRLRLSQGDGRTDVPSLNVCMAKSIAAGTVAVFVEIAES